MDPTIATIYGAIIGGSCSIFGAWFGAKFAINFQSRRNAEHAFSDAIHEILVGMYPDPIHWPEDSWRAIQGKMPEMQCAVHKLAFHLNPNEVARLNIAWNDYKKYCNTIKDGEIQAKPLYPSSQSVDQVSVFKNKVSRLLNYKNA